MTSDIGGRRPTPDRQPTQPAQRHAHDGRHPEPIDFTLSNQDIFELTEAVEKRGGSFEKALALALRRADPINKRLILEQWPQLVTKFGPNGTLR